MTVTKRLRYEVLRRDNHTCRYCGSAAPEVTLTVDHVTPTALGGTDLPDNLVAACRDCNSGKSATPSGAPLVADVKQDALRWAAARQAAAEEMTSHAEDRWHYLQNFVNAWELYAEDTHYGRPFPLPGSYILSVHRFHDLGLPASALWEAVQIAVHAKVPPDQVWRYMCGVAWKMLAQLNESAQRHLDSETA